MQEKITEQMINELFETILKLESIEDCKDLFEDLCTYKEVEQMAQRVKSAKLLKEDHTYAEVIAQTDISSATLSRVSRCLKHGKGYKKFID